MIASVVGASSARRRIVGAVCGVRQWRRTCPRPAIAASMRSFVVRAGPSPTWERRSPQKSVPVVSSIEDVGVPAVGHVRGVDASEAPPTEVDEPSGPSGTGGRSARSLIDTMQPMAVWATWALGAAARKRFIAPHSSASRWPKVIQRRRSSGITEAMASDTTGNMRAWSGVEDGRFVSVDEELVEREAGRPDVGHERGHPVDAIGDLVDVGFPWLSLLSFRGEVGG